MASSESPKKLFHCRLLQHLYDDRSVLLQLSQLHITSPFAKSTNSSSSASPPPPGEDLEAVSDQIDTVNTLKGAFHHANSKDTDTIHDINRNPDKQESQFRQYEEACDSVKAFYKEQHEKQTVAYNLKARMKFKTKKRGRMTVWEAMEKYADLISFLVISFPRHFFFTSSPRTTYHIPRAVAVR